MWQPGCSGNSGIQTDKQDFSIDPWKASSKLSKARGLHPTGAPRGASRWRQKGEKFHHLSTEELHDKSTMGWKSICASTQKFYTWCIWQDNSVHHKEKKVALSGADRSDRSHRPVRPVFPRQPAKTLHQTICITLSQYHLDRMIKSITLINTQYKCPQVHKR